MNNDKILIVDDERKMCIVLKAAFENIGLAVTTANSGEAAMAALDMDKFAVIISDIKMPGMSGLDLLAKVKVAHPETEVLLMTAYADAQTAVQAMKSGAYDYIIKPFEIDELRHKVSHILEKSGLKAENQDLKKKLKNRYSLDNMVGKSGVMQKVYELVDKVAPSDATVLVRGESGTGKELVAQAIHYGGPRKEQPFMAVNCSALPETLLESELFGYEKGAFTGADKQKPGLFELAGHGTIFLDEIGDMTPATQVKLLRVLQAREVFHLGGSQAIPIQARTIAATNRNLEQAVRDKAFREDLYYRINVFPITLPPLRERKQDVPDLVAHFMSNQGADPQKIEPRAIKLLMEYAWPGNVRELENVVERALIMAGNAPVTVNDLPPHIRGEAEMPLEIQGQPDEMPTLDEMERRMIRNAIAKAEGNKTRAAAMLGISRRQLYSMMERLMVGEEL
ncbi:MAG TPA: sigma-54 dependent transcriptional regulator [bacterium]|nr:sigma-54 dependent transcriptional regulator [bacterium]HPN45253.1 sigma-54 dependent transcriptional regulator [bacterium]